MAGLADTFAPPTPQDAPGLRSQFAQDLFTAMPQLAEDIRTPPLQGQRTLDFMRLLRSAPTPEEALTLLAYALQPRHAIWWGHECLKAAPDLLTGQDIAMLDLLAGWVAEPDEEHRYAALDGATQALSRGPGVWMALAAGWSGGSMSDPKLPPVPPPPFLMGRALNAGVLGALARVPQDKRRRTLDHFTGIGEVLAKSA